MFIQPRKRSLQYSFPTVAASGDTISPVKKWVPHTTTPFPRLRRGHTLPSGFSPPGLAATAPAARGPRDSEGEGSDRFFVFVCL